MTQPGQTVLVSGSNSGFGRLIVETLARQGHSVFAGMRELTGRNASAAAELTALAARERLTLRAVALDVTDSVSVTQAVNQVIETAGRLDVVVNNAGVSYVGPLEAFTLEQVQRQFDTNVYGVWRVITAALPHMRAQQSGLLLQVGSIVGRLGFPYFGLYGATKFALEGLTESLRYELAPLGIDAVIVEPGTFPTAIGTNRQAPGDQGRLTPYQAGMDAFLPAFFAENRDATPPDPQQVADAIAQLIAQSAGTRPLRTVVASASQRPAPEALNEAAAKAMQTYLQMLGVAPKRRTS
jgi:NAD(P)-dependent dehydrogenase (short-subunit alcohol dehydrogenase family)